MTEALVRTLFALGAVEPADVRTMLGETQLSEREARLAFARLSRWQTT